MCTYKENIKTQQFFTQKYKNYSKTGIPTMQSYTTTTFLILATVALVSLKDIRLYI